MLHIMMVKNFTSYISHRTMMTLFGLEKRRRRLRTKMIMDKVNGVCIYLEFWTESDDI
jgi:hypothetical protein